jgi:ABC-2 type transport system permease protein
MSSRANAIRAGVRRGWIEFVQSVRSPQDQGFYLFTAVVVLAYLLFNRNNEVEGSDLLYPTVAMPSILGALIAFGMIVGPAYGIAMEREDGTLLRAKAVPNGILGHVVGYTVSYPLGVIPSFLVILVPGMFLFTGLMANGVEGWVTVAWVTILGILATLPIGIVIGSLVPGVQKVGTWGMLPFFALTAISGIFYPIDALWGWLQGVAQVFPLYWIGLGMRSAFLPDSAAALEVGGSWRTGLTVFVLSMWAIAGLAVAPAVVRRMARRQSGSTVEAAREQALQWVR